MYRRSRGGGGRSFVVEDFNGRLHVTQCFACFAAKFCLLLHPCMYNFYVRATHKYTETHTNMDKHTVEARRLRPLVSNEPCCCYFTREFTNETRTKFYRLIQMSNERATWGNEESMFNLKYVKSCFLRDVRVLDELFVKEKIRNWSYICSCNLW